MAAAPGTQAYYSEPAEQRRQDYQNAVAAIVGQGGGRGDVPIEAYFTPAEVAWIQGAAQAHLAPWQTEVQKKFPSYASYLNNPEIAGILKDAIDHKWPPQVLESHVQASVWWKSHNPSQRSWYLLNTTDPAGALQSVQQQYAAVKLKNDQLGLGLTAGQMMNMSIEALSVGWSDQQLTNHMVSAGTNDIHAGSMGVTRANLHSIADDYLMPVSDHTLDSWTKRIAAGATTPDAFKDQMSRAAATRYSDPGIREALQHGMTIKEFADPYMQMAAQTLGINPNEMDLLQPKWQKPLNFVDDKGQKRAMTMDEWQTAIKMNPIYGYDHSRNGIDEAASLVSNLKQQFGYA